MLAYTKKCWHLLKHMYKSPIEHLRMVIIPKNIEQFNVTISQPLPTFMTVVNVHCLISE